MVFLFMSKINASLRAYHCNSAILALVLVSFALQGCDRGASAEIETARKFSDAVARNQAATRDTMIATFKFKEYFKDVYVADDMFSWFRTFYDFKTNSFATTARADVDRDLAKELQGALIDTSA